MKWKLVIADDDPSVLEIFQIIFEKAGYETITLSNPKPLLHNQYTDADIFLLDKQMSGADGIEICKYLKQNERTRDKPVLIISANPSAKALSEEAGADGFIEKPFLKKELLAKVEMILQRYLVCDNKE